MRKKIAPNIAKNDSVIAPLAAENRRLRNSRTSSIGSGVWRSQATKPATSAAAAAKAPTMRGSVQPHSGASMMPHTSALRPAVESTKPGTSSRGAAGSRDSGTSGRCASRAATTNGMLTRKIQLQSACSTIQPPATGPIAMPSPDTAAQAPIAFARSCAGNVAVRIDSVEGMMNAPPTPISARLAISISAEPAMADSSEPRPKTASPNESALRRPKRSPSAPAVSSRPANTSMYESTIHWSCELDAPRSSSSVGSATLRIVLSSEMTSSDRHRTTRVHQRRGSGSAVGIGGLQGF